MAELCRAMCMHQTHNSSSLSPTILHVSQTHARHNVCVCGYPTYVTAASCLNKVQNGHVCNVFARRRTRACTHTIVESSADTMKKHQQFNSLLSRQMCVQTTFLFKLCVICILSSTVVSHLPSIACVRKQKKRTK